MTQHYMLLEGLMTSLPLKVTHACICLTRLLWMHCTHRLVKNDMGQNKGFGFCEFCDEVSADKAIKQFNNYEMNGRLLRVR